MNQDTFTQTSSIIKQLRLITIVIVVFIFSCLIAFLITNQNLMGDFQKLNTANNILNGNSMSIDKLNINEEIIETILSAPDTKESEKRFRTNMIRIKELFRDNMERTKEEPKLFGSFNVAYLLLLKYEKACYHIFQKFSNLQAKSNAQEIDETKKLIDQTKMLFNSTTDQLRRAQQLTKLGNDQIFSEIYKSRFKPAIVLILSSAVFLAFVVIFGRSLFKRLARSVLTLLEATENVSKGNFDFQATIHEQDEVGRISFAFNKMISSLKAGQDNLSQVISRLSRLQEITASFSEALTPNQVFEVIFKQAFETMEATTGSILLLSDDGKYLELKRLEGFNSDIYGRWRRFSLGTDLPVCEVVKTKEALFTISSQLNRYSALQKNIIDGPPYAIAYLPLVVDNRSLGVLTFSFPINKKFDQVEKNFLLSLTRQCAQAIHRSQLYDDAKKAIEVRDEFLAIASHELRTPLTPLKMQIQAVARQMQDSTNGLSTERLAKMIETSDRQVNRLSLLIDDLLDVTRITSGKMSLNRELFSLQEMIKGIVQQYTQQLSRSHAKVELIIEDDLVGHWDKVRIEQVIINILTNAAKYAPNKPIKTLLTRSHSVAKIQITDQGPGIAIEDQERIFKRFERVSDKQNIGGLGLGLYISKQIIEAHNGKIYVHSVPGHGSTFTIELPEVNG